MGNPTYVQGPISLPPGEELLNGPYLVTIRDGKVFKAGADDDIYGVVTETVKEGKDANATLQPSVVAVHMAPATVTAKISGANIGDEVKAGTKIYAGANGAFAKTGSKLVGFVVETGTWTGGFGVRPFGDTWRFKIRLLAPVIE